LRRIQRRHIASRLPIGDGVEQSNGVAAAGAARNLGGAKNGGVVGSVGEVGETADVRVQLRRPADATRVEEVEARCVAAEKAVEVPEIERVAAGNEERPLLLVVSLVRRKIDGRRVDLHLTEIGVDGGIESEAWREQVFDIRARAHATIVAIVIRITWLRVLELLARLDIRQQLQLTRLRA